MRGRNLLFSAAHVARRLYWRALGPRTIGVRGIVVDADGRVLLVRHSYGTLRWHLPGGGVKRREHLADAAARELREEAAIVVDPARLELFGAYSNLTEGKSDHIVVFLARQWERAAPGGAPVDREIVAIDFFDPAALPAQVSGGTARRLGELGSSAPRRFTW